jgi:guanylate kinase
MTGKLFIISGPSGVGKDTVANALISNSSISNLKKLPTYTTRKPRPGEKQGKQYYFVTKPEFKKLIAQGKILEWNIYNNNYYGTSRDDLEKALKNGQVVILAIDVHGALNIKKQYPDCCLIFIKSKLSDIKSRLIKRGQNTAEEIKERLKTAKNELKYEKFYDYSVENPEGNPEKAVKEVKKIIQKETWKK